MSKLDFRLRVGVFGLFIIAEVLNRIMNDENDSSVLSKLLVDSFIKKSLF